MQKITVMFTMKMVGTSHRHPQFIPHLLEAILIIGLIQATSLPLVVDCSPVPEFTFPPPRLFLINFTYYQNFFFRFILVNSIHLYHNYPLNNIYIFYLYTYLIRPYYRIRMSVSRIGFTQRESEIMIAAFLSHHTPYDVILSRTSS